VDSVGEELERLARLRASGDLTDAEYELLKTQLIHRERDAARSEKTDRARSQVPGWFTKKEGPVHTTLSREIWQSIRASLGEKGHTPGWERGGTQPLRGYAPEKGIGTFPIVLASSPIGLLRQIPDRDRVSRSTVNLDASAWEGFVLQGERHIRISLSEWDRHRTSVTGINVVLVPTDYPGFDEVSQRQNSIVGAVKEQQRGKRASELAPSDENNEHLWCFIGSVGHTEKHARYISVQIGPSPEDVLCIGRLPAHPLANLGTLKKGPSPRVVLTALEELRQKTWSN